MTINFDFEKFQKLLLVASKKAFTSIQKAHKNQEFYIFALYTTGDLSYVLPTASTEEGLTSVAIKYSSYKEYAEYSLEQLREHLRWSPSDSPLHTKGEEYFVDVNNYVLEVPLILDSIPTEDNWNEFNLFYNKFMNTCVNVLKLLDKDGVFGKGRKRSSVVLNLLMGDQSDEERLRFAKILNPSPVYTYFQQIYHA